MLNSCSSGDQLAIISVIVHDVVLGQCAPPTLQLKGCTGLQVQSAVFRNVSRELGGACSPSAGLQLGTGLVLNKSTAFISGASFTHMSGTVAGIAGALVNASAVVADSSFQHISLTRWRSVCVHACTPEAALPPSSSTLAVLSNSASSLSGLQLMSNVSFSNCVVTGSGAAVLVADECTLWAVGASWTECSSGGAADSAVGGEWAVCSAGACTAFSCTLQR